MPGPVPIALSTASAYPATCVEAFALAKNLGYDGLEVMVWTDAVSQDAAAIARLSEHYEVPVLSIHAPTLLVTQGVWSRAPWPKVERSCEMAAHLGAGVVVVHPPFRWQREYAAEFAERIPALEAEHGVAIAVENMFPWRARAREMQAYLPGWDPVPLGYDHVTLDLSHCATAGSDALAMADALGERLTHLHLADGSGSPKDEHLVPGRGTQPCAEMLERLVQRQWPGIVVVEVNTRGTKTPEAREELLAESLAFTRYHMGGGG